MSYDALFVLLGYLLGSIPFAYLVGRARGVDVFELGTQNPGTANVFRKVGRRAGAAVFVGDVSKGALPVLVAKWAGVSPWLALAVGLGVLAGHWFPVFLGFRGGAGLASVLGVTYAMMPVPSLIATPVVVVSVYLSHNTAWSAAGGFVVFFIAATVLYEPLFLTLGTVALAGLTGVRQALLPTSGR